jgi:hypothetical protein
MLADLIIMAGNDPQGPVDHISSYLKLDKSLASCNDFLPIYNFLHLTPLSPT